MRGDVPGVQRVHDGLVVQSYAIMYYVFGGNIAHGAEFAEYAGTDQSIATFCVIALVTWLGTQCGKKRAFQIAIGVSMLGYALK
jgi:GPH family glycoside/pentoside/hexuronide:cation symporter